MYSIRQSIARYAATVALAAAAVGIISCSAPVHALTLDQCTFLADVGAKAAAYVHADDEAGFGQFLAGLDATVTDPELREYTRQVLGVGVQAAQLGTPAGAVRAELMRQCVAHVSWEQRS